ncbi:MULTISPECIES: response regulator [Dyadobacter]|jgi:two-component system, OmpR family, alkaline phosphatase synthesis response regulator PhoP|uniref:Phosphate regulon transcriptional regulatory protein PhoB n=2 Tax=Dyadobacter TaxID=120831 RepID=A0A2P8GED0_9BACT|nr:MULTISPECIES: response regulator transcription factor [Dyadobacter]MBO9615834.1 response regulator transcription factor [Dyadobacter sp.]MBZ1363098.1 response regulator transcription factor [Dyadobacter fermentans]MDR6809457.1 two-component system alkaline phosphatase synthesis response regulator PhoP [Dyadobacter fermentans]MDR7047407.1 two-component system alkaline phosphatase synthesis response regulator PhoP [Dyadobacter sp. BE242]MDR7195084.1 two-component system alkaline phosphatase s
MSTAKSANSAPKVLVVDDDSDIVELLEYNLTKEGYSVLTASNGKKAIDIAKAFVPDLILLDIMMPQLDGIETGRILRQNPDIKNTYILFLTARSEEYSEVAAFEVGADDYITKPIKPRALMSRINALFRREAQKAESGDTIEILDLSINRKNYTVTQGGEKSTVLPKKEFELLFFLAQTPNKVFSRDELLQKIWGADIYVLERTVDVHIRKLREKLGDNYIKTLKGVGYMFSNERE